MTDQAPAQPKTYAGGCQCGAVSFEADSTLEMLIECNCSRCRRLGSILTFVQPDQFRLLKGEGDLQTFEFNSHKIEHRFCRTCGIEPFARGETPRGDKMVAVNVRCLEGVDVWSLEPKQVDGASF
jgi:hypothetical protein